MMKNRLICSHDDCLITLWDALYINEWIQPPDRINGPYYFCVFDLLDFFRDDQ